MTKILIVDDSEDIVEITKYVLERLGYTANGAANGAEGLVALNHGCLPDCIILDVDMPVMNGPTMVHKMIIHDSGQEDIPIILVSNRTDVKALAAMVGTPYFLEKCSTDYMSLLSDMLIKVLAEQKTPHPPGR